MDGNGRWAERRGHPRFYGHVRGTKQVRKVVRTADRLGVKALTLYAFSTENWNRPAHELNVLWKLLKKFIRSELEVMNKQNVRFRVFGQIDRLDPELQTVINEAVDKLAHNTGLQLNFAISYGARSEIIQAIKRFGADCLSGKESFESLDESKLNQYLWTAPLEGLSDVDFVIRTSGEMRVSNFLLWQSAYAEYYFTETCWPDFGEKEFVKAIETYGCRNRRYGRTSLDEKIDPPSSIVH
tara:strand:- start:3052 stop:3771 length:720 start_codon:yes stop_codon:yes gene_type:complete